MAQMPLQQEVTPQQRAMNFQSFTRQWRQAEPAVIKKPGEKFKIEIPQVNLFAGAWVLFEATLNAVHATLTSFTPANHAPYTIAELIKITANLAYTPWETSGIGAYWLQLFTENPGYLQPVYGAKAPTDANKRRWSYMGDASDTSGNSGADNKISTMLMLPTVINNRDPVGLINAANEKTHIYVEGKLGVVGDLAPAATGFTFSLGDVTITPMIDTFTIPPIPEAIPDQSVVKLVQEQTDVTVAGVWSYKLPIGPTYRRIVFGLTDSSGNPVDDDTLTGDIELVLNKADKPIILPGKMLQRLYQWQTNGGILPRGVWGLDFTHQGLINYGGRRDLLDTDGMGEIWITVRGPAAYNFRVVYEALEQLK